MESFRESPSILRLTVARVEPGYTAEERPRLRLRSAPMSTETPTWEELYRRLPDEMRPFQLEIAWSRAKLWALNLPTEEMSLKELTWQLSLPWWRDGASYFALCPTDVLASPERYPEQYARTLRADLGRPIHITLRQGRWFVLDGVHRLLKAVLVGTATISVRKLYAPELEQIGVEKRNVVVFDRERPPNLPSEWGVTSSKSRLRSSGLRPRMIKNDSAPPQQRRRKARPLLALLAAV